MGVAFLHFVLIASLLFQRILMRDWEAISKTGPSCFITRAVPAPRHFIVFSVFGKGDETLALVFDILPRKLHRFENASNFKIHPNSKKH